MLRSANEGIAQLTAALEDAQRDACDAAAAAARTEKDAAARYSEAGHRQRALRLVGLCLARLCVCAHSRHATVCPLCHSHIVVVPSSAEAIIWR